MRSKRAFTLIELLLSTVLLSTMLVGFSSLFVSEYNSRQNVKDEVVVARDATAVIDHMSSVLRHADPGTVRIQRNGQNILVSATIRSGRLSFVPVGSDITYIYDGASRRLDYFQQNWGAPI